MTLRLSDPEWELVNKLAELNGVQLSGAARMAILKMGRDLGLPFQDESNSEAIEQKRPAKKSPRRK